MKHTEAPVSRETRERLLVFEGLLKRWQMRINLVAPGDQSVIWERHIEDSLQLAPLMPSAVQSAVDVGSGAGFPGLILAIATGVAFHLVESDKRKASFLREAARVTGADVTIHTDRVEHVVFAQAAELLTARAFAPLTKLLAATEAILSSTTVCLLPKGRGWEAELTTALQQWQMRVEQFPSRIDASGVILRLSGLARL